MKLKDFANKYFSVFVKVSFGIFLISLAVHILSRISSTVAERLTVSVGSFIRQILAQITDIIPFSLGEILLILLPLFLTFFIVLLVKIKGKERIIRLFCSVLAIISLFYSVYVFTLGAAYNRTPVAKSIELDTEQNITAEDLYKTYVILKESAEAELDKISFADSGASVNDITIWKMSDIISEAYKKVDVEYPELSLGSFNTKAKPVIMSRGLAGFEILGIYSFFTGESNVNVHYPDFLIPFTVAHEFSHQRGIARENEANFLAFLVCREAEDPYVRYSGYLNMLEYVASALFRAEGGEELYKKAMQDTDERIIGEMRAYSEFYRENKNQIMAAISDFVNDAYLKSQGTPGIVSYSNVVKLCVAYYRGQTR